ncbi:hypothetical protein LUZ61_020090 [Rhynchospora tenuis]|uniref:BZIP domain-containing protein n=1 Tax=Rhynchospora tenuis TaxID=198213 RepID=A0AAD5ZCB3_9POAL|nr:hypothetical protein LUZ61_020090 [Rhynchospora tenuis]
MASNEPENSSKSPKKSSAQEQPSVVSSAPATPVYADWSNFQAYSPVPPHGFFPSAVASSPQAHPYMWGAQPMMPPYGTPPPYVMYPPGGIYAHPAMPPGSHPFSPYAMPAANGNAEAPNGQETDRKSSEGKEKSPIKRSKGSLGSLNMITGKNNGNEPGKTSGTSANGAVSHSGDSATDSSSDGSDANSQNDSTPKGSGGEEPYGGSGRSSENGMARTPSQAMLNQSAGVVSVAAGPTTNLNIGMDYWASPGSTAGAAGLHVKAPVSNAVVPSEHWIQDERELKKQRRKQSNRESARRSRLRKQAECEELAQRADVLKQENAALRAEVERIRKEYDDLLAQNSSLKEKLGQIDPNSDETRSDRNDENPENHK